MYIGRGKEGELRSPEEPFQVLSWPPEPQIQQQEPSIAGRRSNLALCPTILDAFSGLQAGSWCRVGLLWPLRNRATNWSSKIWHRTGHKEEEMGLEVWRRPEHLLHRLKV